MANQAATSEAARPRFRQAASRLWQMAAPFAGLAAVIGVFLAYQMLFKPESPFLTQFRATLLVKHTCIIAMGALGMTVIIISGGIDLSAGSLLALCAVSLAVILDSGVEPATAVLLVMLIGTAAGAINGLAITGLRLVPFIVTLGTMLAFRGLAEQVAQQQKIVVSDTPAWLSTLLDPPASGSLLMMCNAGWLIVGLAVVLALLLRRTVFGRYVVAVGSNEATARLCGINVSAVKIAVYALGGFFMALAGILNFNLMNSQGDPTAGRGMELDIIAAVVIGGGSLNGGRGSVLGTLVGALTMTVLRSGCVYAGVSDPVQKIVIGGIIIGAVALDQVLHRRKAA